MSVVASTPGAPGSASGPAVVSPPTNPTDDDVPTVREDRVTLSGEAEPPSGSAPIARQAAAHPTTTFAIDQRIA